MRTLWTILGLLAVAPSVQAAFNFNGSTQYIVHGTAVLTTEPFTMVAWVRSTNTSANQNVFCFTSGSGAATWFAIQLRGGDTSKVVRAVAFTSGSPAAVFADTTAQYSSGVWHHTAAVFATDSSRAAYIDGANKGTDGTTRNPTFSSTLDRTVIGAGLNSGSIIAAVTGDIGEAAIWNVALTDAEIASLSRGVSPLRVRPSALVFYAPLWRELIEYRAGAALTNNGTTAANDHPRRYR